MIVKQSTASPFQTRMPKEFRSYIKEQAALNGRSMNTEIIFRLRQAYGFIDKVLEASKHETA